MSDKLVILLLTIIAELGFMISLNLECIRILKRIADSLDRRT